MRFGPQLLAVITALAGAVALTPAARRLAVYMGAIDTPGPRKVHASPMPLWGGMAIYLSSALAAFLFVERVDADASKQVAAVFGGATLLVVVGSLDDRRLLHPQIKLMGAMPAAALVLVAAGIRATVFTAAFGPSMWWTAADLVLTLVWVVGITAAFSILDHMDGLCAGVAAIAAAFYVGIALSGGQLLVATLASAVLGAAVGFLHWNFNPARIFMGDGGAMFLGFMMATLGLKLRVDPLSVRATALVPVFILAVPIFDTTLVTISRTRRGLLPFATPGKDHTSHRLTVLGFGHRGAVLALYSLGLVGGTLALVLTWVSAMAGYVVAAVSACTVLALIAGLERTAFERQPPSARVVL